MVSRLSLIWTWICVGEELYRRTSVALKLKIFMEIVHFARNNYVSLFKVVCSNEFKEIAYFGKGDALQGSNGDT